MQRSTFFICTALMIDPTGNSLGSSLNINQDLRNQLKAILPQAFSDNNLDFEKLKQLLGDDFTSPRQERYGISWAGKTDAFRELQQTTTNTLAPQPPEGEFLSPTAISPSVGERSRTHEGIFIEGENLEVLKVLQKSYYGKVKMIYIDPPYNTGNDSFVYPDDFSETKAAYQEKGNINLNRLNLWQKNSKDSGKYHSSWLSMMYPRLFMARNLLREDGVIFISIDDNEQANLKLLMDEIFGEENFVACFIWKSRQNKDNRNLSGVSIDHEYIISYSKNSEYRALKGSERKTEQYTNPDNDPRGDWASGNMVGLLSEDLRPNCHYDLINPETGINYGKPKMGWRYDKKTMKRLIDEKRILWSSNEEGRPRRKVFLNELSENLAGFSSLVGENIYTRNATIEIEKILEGRFFDFPKPLNLIKSLINQVLVVHDNDIILDFFAGSGTTAHAVMELNAEDGGNRQFICVQMPEPTDEKSEAYKAGYQTIAAITRARIQKVQAKLPFRAAAVAGGGVKFYKLQPSNFKIWQSDIDTEEELLKQLEIYAQPHTEAETPEENLLTELILKAGFMLTANVQTISSADGIKLYDIENGTMTVALSTLSEKVILTVCERKPKEFICLDNLFESDVQKSNWSLQLAEAGVNLQVI
jgi:adenine-specific DNA-methyltransferase